MCTCSRAPPTALTYRPRIYSTDTTDVPNNETRSFRLTVSFSTIRLSANVSAVKLDFQTCRRIKFLKQKKRIRSVTWLIVEKCDFRAGRYVLPVEEWNFQTVSDGLPIRWNSRSKNSISKPEVTYFQLDVISSREIRSPTRKWRTSGMTAAIVFDF